MSYNPTLKELVFLFKDTVEEGAVAGVYHDMHGNGVEAMTILQQLQESMVTQEAPSNQQSSSGQPTSASKPNKAGNDFKPWYVSKDSGFKISNSLGERRLNPDRIRIPGYHDRKALYIMRGLSGSGKSTYAKKIVMELGRGEIFSTDDFFMLNEKNEYRFVAEDLQIAHKWNQTRVEGALSEGMSPVIVDNTNTQFWEMRPYVIAGVESGYNCYFIEPPTAWKFKVNQLYRKSKHGLNKGQLVAALKRYEKNPTVEQVIGPAYLSKMRHTHCTGESSSEMGYVPYTSHKTGKKGEEEGAPLVPYILSDSSDESCEREVARGRGRHCPVNPAQVTVNYREYNNNSACPKVITEPCIPGASGVIGSGHLGNSGQNSAQSTPDNDKKNSGDKLSDEKKELEDTDIAPEWDQDMANWLADIAAREIEDELLAKLEKQKSAEGEEALSVMIDVQKLREESVKKLSTWESEDRVGIPQGRKRNEIVGAELKECREIEEAFGEHSADHAVEEIMEDDIPDLNDDDSSDEFITKNPNIVQVRSSDSVVINFVPAVYTLKEMCRAKLKISLITSYYNSTEYWNTYEEARDLPHVGCRTSLPPPPSQPHIEITSPDSLVISPDLLDSYAVVTEDTITVSPDTRSNIRRQHSDRKAKLRHISRDACANDSPIDAEDEDTLEKDDFELEHAVEKEKEQTSRQIEMETIQKVESNISDAEDEDTLEKDDFELEDEVEKEKDLTWKQIEMETIKKVESTIGCAERETLLSVSEESDSEVEEEEEEDTLERSLPQKKTLRDIDSAEEEAIKEEEASPTITRLIQQEPPSIRRLLKLDEDIATEQVESGNETDKGEESEMSSSSTASPASHTRQDSKDDTTVATLSLPPKLVTTLTDMYGQIAGLPLEQHIRIPVDIELASLLHAALYFAHISERTSSATKGKEKMKRINLRKSHPPLVVPNVLSVPFNEIVQYQRKLPERKGKLKKLIEAYPGMDETFLEDVLSSCGNDLQRVLTALTTDSVHLKYMDDRESLYSSKTEYTPVVPEKSKPSDVRYTYLKARAPQTSNYFADNVVIPPGTLVEQAEAYRKLSQHNMDMARMWHSKKHSLVAGHYAKQGTKYRELAEDAELELFDGTIVKERLKELKVNPVLDLHGYTLAHSKYLLSEALQHFSHVIGQDPEHPRTLTVITGKGRHSAGGTPILKHGVKAFLNTISIPYNEEPDGYKIKFR